MLRKLNLTFVTSVTLEIKVTTPLQIGFFEALRENYKPDMKLIAVNLFDLSRGNRCVFGQTDKQTDRWTVV